MIVEIDDALGMIGQSRRIAGQEVLAVADAEDQRAAQPRADQHSRFAETEDGQTVSALEQGQHPADRFNQVILILTGDEMSDNLGVRIAVEDDAIGLQLTFESGIVLNDAVMHDHDVTLAAQMRMSVAIGSSA